MISEHFTSVLECERQLDKVNHSNEYLERQYKQLKKRLDMLEKNPTYQSEMRQKVAKTEKMIDCVK